jgi:hypothetical protein
MPKITMKSVRDSGGHVFEDDEVLEAIRVLQMNHGPGLRDSWLRQVLGEKIGRPLSDEEWVVANRQRRRVKREVLRFVLAEPKLITRKLLAGPNPQELPEPDFPKQIQAKMDAEGPLTAMNRLARGAAMFTSLYSQIEHTRMTLQTFAADILANVRRRRVQGVETCELCGRPGDHRDARDLRLEEQNYARIMSEAQKAMGQIQNIYKLLFESQPIVKFQTDVEQYFHKHHPELIEEFASFLEARE